MFDKFLTKQPISDTNGELKAIEGFLDCTNVIALIPKNDKIKNYIKTNYITNEHKSVTGIICDKLTSDTIVGLDFLIPALELLHNFSDTIRIRTGNNYPLIMENDDLAIIIAPRIKMDNEISRFETLVAKKEEKEVESK
jgi:hypothetical protein